MQKLRSAIDHAVLEPVYETITRVRQGLPPAVAFLGFCGAPWTLATYMIAGQGTPDQAPARLFAYRHPDAFAKLIDVLVDASASNNATSSGDFSLILIRRLNVRGFIILDFLPRWQEAVAQLVRWILEGKLKHRETIVEGLENAPAALNQLFDGANIGKLLVKVAN